MGCSYVSGPQKKPKQMAKRWYCSSLPLPYTQYLCANPGRRDKNFFLCGPFVRVSFRVYCVIGLRPASDGRVLVPASLRARFLDATAGLMPRVGIVISAFILTFVFLLSSGSTDRAATSAPGVFNGGQMDVVAADRLISTDVWSKIEAIGRMGIRGVLRVAPRHDLIAAVFAEKLADSTENPVRIAARCVTCRVSMREGLGRAPPRFNL
jgi:hypothetical protein